jgi:hypothetical protein
MAMSNRIAASGVRSAGDVQLPYRMLALRVIHLAVRDAVDGQSVGIRSSARQFLSGCPLLSLWCALAELDPASITGSLGGPRASSTRPSGAKS